MTKTTERVRERFSWYGLQHEIGVGSVRSVPGGSPPKATAREPLVSGCPGFPFERFALDIMGPMSTTESGSKFILVVGDYFTKWKEAFAIPNQEAKTVAEKLVKGVISWSARKRASDKSLKPGCSRKCVCCSRWTRPEPLQTTQKVMEWSSE